jgi:hypothetical protein
MLTIVVLVEAPHAVGPLKMTEGWRELVCSWKSYEFLHLRRCHTHPRKKKKQKQTNNNSSGGEVEKG